MRAHVVYRSLHKGLITKTKPKQESNKNNTKQKQIQKNKATVGVCSAGVQFCSRAEACSPSFLTFWRRNYYFFIVAHPVYKM